MPTIAWTGGNGRHLYELPVRKFIQSKAEAFTTSAEPYTEELLRQNTLTFKTPHRAEFLSSLCLCRLGRKNCWRPTWRGDGRLVSTTSGHFAWLGWESVPGRATAGLSTPATGWAEELGTDRLAAQNFLLLRFCLPVCRVNSACGLSFLTCRSYYRET